MQNRTVCSRCSGALTVTKGAPWPHWGWLTCERCAHRQGYAATPLTHVDSYVMPIGKHKNRMLAEIAATDPGYLRWAATNLSKPRMREVVTFFLARHEATPRQNTPEEAKH